MLIDLKIYDRKNHIKDKLVKKYIKGTDYTVQLTSELFLDSRKRTHGGAGYMIFIL